MEIRKEFKFEVAHIVRNCTSGRCSHSIHGHSVILEVFFTSDKLDNGQMIMDFGLMKDNIKDFIDGFDHCLVAWDKDSDLVDIAKKYSDRHIILPINTSAEAQAIFFVKVLNDMLRVTLFNNGEGNVKVSRVKYHETRTGYAQATIDDLHLLDIDYDKCIFSEQIKNEWGYNIFGKMVEGIKENKKIFINPVVIKQV